ncbi:MAG: glycosyltransferase [Rubrivivax sp.]|nr:glycosyltransferase [Rubrivivax sp.]
MSSSPLHILVIHGAYQHRGGEDSVVDSEIELLKAHGHRVSVMMRSNDEVQSLSRLQLLGKTFWARDSAEQLLRACEEPSRVDVIHAHNTFPLISPSVYWAAARRRIPVVQTLHNFRLLCPQAMFLREGKVCEDCLGQVPWRGAVRGCYRDSRAASSALAGMLTLHRAIGTWQHKVTRYIALNEFCRRKFVEGGLPASRVVVKPNFVEFDGPAPSGAREGLLYVGRLSQEKGIDALVGALARLPEGCLRVAGAGPLATAFEGLVAPQRMLGNISQISVREEMSRSLALVLPSIWYENFPRTLVEAFACGLPVIASRLGALAELVEDGVTGLLVRPSDPADLAEKMQWALQHPDQMKQMGHNARRRFESDYGSRRNHELLMRIYADAMAETRAMASIS